MFEKFGEFDNCEELNRAAEAQLKEGDFDAIRILGKENGIDVDDIDDYLDGMVSTLCTVTTAAIGKLEAETEDLKLEGILKDWVGDIESACMDNREMAVAVRKKGKRLADVMALYVEYGYKNRVTVSKTITARCKELKGVLGTHELTIGEPDRAARKKIWREYYMGGGTQ